MSDGKDPGTPKRSSSVKKVFLNTFEKLRSPGRKQAEDPFVENYSTSPTPPVPRRLTYTQVLQRPATFNGAPSAGPSRGAGTTAHGGRPGSAIHSRQNSFTAGGANHSRQPSITSSNWRGPKERESNLPYEGRMLMPPHHPYINKRNYYLPGNIVLAWHNTQNVHRDIPKGLSQEDVMCWSKTNKNTWVHTKKRPFVVLWTFKEFMIATPMRTHGGRGLGNLSPGSPLYNSHIAVQWRRDLSLKDTGSFAYILETTKPNNKENSSIGIKDAVVLDYREEITKMENSLTRESTEKLIEIWLERAIDAIALDAERDRSDSDSDADVEYDGDNPPRPPPAKRRKFNKQTLKFEEANKDSEKAINKDTLRFTMGNIKPQKSTDSLRNKRPRTI